jgi:hypothetical protein
MVPLGSLTECTGTRHRPISCPRLTQSNPPNPISLRSILILSSHLRVGLQSGLFPSGLATKVFFTFPTRATRHAHLIGLDSIILTTFRIEHKLWSCHYVILSILMSKLSLQHLSSNTVNPCPSPNVRGQVYTGRKT